MKQRTRSLKYQIAWPVAAIITLTIAAISFIGYYASSQALEETFVQELKVVNRGIADRLDTFYAQQEDFARLLSGDATLKYAVTSGDHQVAAQYLERFFDELDLFENLFLSTPVEDTEIFVDGVGGEAVGLHWAGSGFDENIKQTLQGNLWMSDAYRSPVTDRPVVLFTAPMYDGDEIIAIVGLPVDLGKFSKVLVENTKIGETGYPFISDLKGMTLAHPNTDHILTLDFTTLSFGEAMLNTPDGEHLYYHFEGDDKVMNVARNEKYGFLVGSAMEMSEIRAVGFSVAKILVIVGIAGLILTVAIIIVLLFWKLKPIVKTIEVANRISMGDFTVEKLDAKSRDEMQTLAEAFNRMLDSLIYKAGVLETIASGDLSSRVERASDIDGLGESLLKMNASLNSLLGQVNTAIDQVASGSDQVAQASQSLSQGATEQASSLEEISSSLTEINSQARQNAETATEANTLAKTAAEAATAGNDKMQQLASSMDRINESATEITKVVKVIDDIAFQINLLALNANVEAARAGKYGKGFAVVAEEVRNLAVRSASAVKETTGIVEESVRTTEEGATSAKATAEQLDEIVSGSTKVAEFLGEIAIASNEQAQGVEQITSALGQIDQVTQANTASAEESASASEELSSQAMQLKKVIRRFKLSSNGNGSSRESALTEKFAVAPQVTKIEAPEALPELAPVGVAHATAKPEKPENVISLDDEDFSDF